jgi:transcription elongation factor Elf1
MRLVNFRCPQCGYETEIYVKDEKEDKKLDTLSCTYCKTEMFKFNFKNNKQRVFLFDPSS